MHKQQTSGEEDRLAPRGAGCGKKRKDAIQGGGLRHDGGLSCPGQKVQMIDGLNEWPDFCLWTSEVRSSSTMGFFMFCLYH